MAASPVNGLSVTLDVITPEYEDFFISWLDEQPWSTELSRRTQHYGYGYNYKGKSVVTGKPIPNPSPIRELADMTRKLNSPMGKLNSPMGK
ncbi:MAG: hypothetical protein MUO21_01730, partial [Nitrososphaeraceae archaeon]|nr:hypothetical protein [Nitrososphaeraceae archaeon]